MKAPTRFAIGIDDYGLHAGVNAAALSLAEAGRLSAISVMVGAPAWAGQAAPLRGVDSARVDIGLHLDFTEYPLRADHRHGLGRLIAGAYAGRLDRRAIHDEIEAQFDAFEAGLHRPPDHVDGHQHVHQLPVIREAMLEAIARRAASRRPWLRSTRVALRRGASVTLADDFKARVIAALGSQGLRRLAQRHGLPQNAHLLGVYGFDGDEAAYARRLHRWLTQAGSGDLLMCHASQPSRAAAGDGLLAVRVREYGVLASSAFGEALAAAGLVVEPVSRIVAVPA